MKSTDKTLPAALCCLIVILFAGCAGLSRQTAKQETLEERVAQYMQAQVDGKWDDAYSFFDSSSREKITRERYVNRPRNMLCKGFAIEEIALLPSADQATVKVRIDLSFMGYEFKRAPQKQDWVKENGAWFVKAQTQAPPFPKQEKKKQD